MHLTRLADGVKPVFTKEEIKLELQNLHSSIQMEEFWNQFKYKNYFVEDIRIF